MACGLSGRPNSNTGGRPQHYGTQWLEDPIDGRIRPWKLAGPERVNELRAEAGLEPMHPFLSVARNCPPSSSRRSTKISAGGRTGSLAKDGDCGAFSASKRLQQRRLFCGRATARPLRAAMSPERCAI